MTPSVRPEPVEGLHFTSRTGQGFDKLSPNGCRSALAGVTRFVCVALAVLIAFAFAHPAFAQAAPAAPGAGNTSGALTRALGQVSGDGRSLSLSLQILILMSLLTVLPSLVLMMTSFTRIIIVLSLLRQALGLQQTPPNQVLVGLALFLSLFVMRPAIDQINAQAFDPYGNGQISIEEAVGRAGKVLHGFMSKQTRQNDLKMFAGLAEAPAFRSPADVPFTILLPAFVTSELKTAFQIGFMIFLPFLIIDLVVASTLMALGMMMLSPTIISMPFKLLLFVLVDGWALTMGSLASSFAT
ncbi:flagellar type III secretion system pore protein FliP [Sphingobium phenoxybenzoativorans]|uniref:flagellar type III secretion system pore protein FliP n=1 Tax=Sphingobium phenoxybenzoativorans TaxID=1592790 RepID=UPI003CCEAFAC